MVKKFIEFIAEESSDVVINVIDKDDDFIKKLMHKLSFTYKKIKERHTRPISIIGITKTDNINLDIIMSNKDTIKFEYDGDLKIHINNKLLYHDDVDYSKLIDKIYYIYTNYLKEQKYILNKSNPFD